MDNLLQIVTGIINGDDYATDFLFERATRFITNWDSY